MPLSEGVLEVLNCLLSAGEVPGLFTSEELSKELAALDSKRDKDPHYQVTAEATLAASARSSLAQL